MTSKFPCLNRLSKNAGKRSFIFAGPREPPCPNGHYWTSWYDRDDPTGNCDCETLKDLRKEQKHKICYRPTQVDVKIKGTGVRYDPSLPNVVKNNVVGFRCNNADGPDCVDYEARFCCQEGRYTCVNVSQYTVYSDEHLLNNTQTHEQQNISQTKMLIISLQQKCRGATAITGPSGLIAIIQRGRAIVKPWTILSKNTQAGFVIAPPRLTRESRELSNDTTVQTHSISRAH